MSINHAILGMLSKQPLTGYDMKKIMQDSTFLPWSGNNNQIYKALLELSDYKYVTSELCHQDSSPSKKVYTITEAGLRELKVWLKSAPEAFELKKPFLVQLAWGDLLSTEELEALLRQYEQEIRGQLLVAKKKSETGFFREGRTVREQAIWSLINENISISYQSELDWIHKVRETLPKAEEIHHETAPVSPPPSERKHETMDYQIIEKNNERYLKLIPGGKPIENEQDVVELFSACVENNIRLLLIYGDRLSDDFLRLQTGIAGIALQKFTMYRMKAAVILEESRTKGRFKEFLTESNKGQVFRNFQTSEAAESWLLKDNERM